MKKLLSVILAAGLLASCFSISAFATETETETELTLVEKALIAIERADVDGDLSYTTNDAVILLKAAAGIEESKAEYDIDADGNVSVLDAQKLLRIAAGVEGVVPGDVALEIFNENLNDVKRVKPGFHKTATAVCPTIKVTTTGAPFSSLNVTNMEYNQYVNKLISFTESLGSIAGGDIATEIEAMRASAVEAYQPQTVTKTVYSTSNSHYSYFPVNNLGWSSKLTVEDIESINCNVSDGKLVVSVNMADYTYKGDAYPTGSNGFSERQQLPYGKVFNIPAFDESDGSTVNSVQFKDGVVSIDIDLTTKELTEVDYSFSYISNITAAQEEDSNLVMKTNTTTNVTENYIIGVEEEA